MSSPDVFTTETAGLPEVARPSVIRLRDGEHLDLDISPVRNELDGAGLRMLAYNGSIPRPTVQVDQGSEITVRVTNSGEVETTVHWHGLRLENRYDGVPHETQEPIPIGGSFTYAVQFPDAGFYWYHPHLREDFAQEMGLYGTIVVESSDPNGLSAVRGWREPRGDDTVPASGYVCPMHPEVTASERQLCMESSPS